MKNKKIKSVTTFDELLESKYGKIGSNKRDEFEEKAQYFVISAMLKEARKEAHPQPHAGQTGAVNVPSGPRPDPAIIRRTQIVDIARAVPAGVLAPLEASILLTIAIKQFHASGLAKGLLAAGAGFGLLASPLVTSIARKLGRPVMSVAAAVVAIGTCGLAVAMTGRLWLMILGSIAGLAALNSIIPLTTLTYERNFPTATRG